MKLKMTRGRLYKHTYRSYTNPRILETIQAAETARVSLDEREETEVPGERPQSQLEIH